MKPACLHRPIWYWIAAISIGSPQQVSGIPLAAGDVPDREGCASRRVVVLPAWTGGPVSWRRAKALCSRALMGASESSTDSAATAHCRQVRGGRCGRRGGGSGTGRARRACAGGCRRTGWRFPRLFCSLRRRPHRCNCAPIPGANLSAVGGRPALRLQVFPEPAGHQHSGNRSSMEHPKKSANFPRVRDGDRSVPSPDDVTHVGL